VGEASLRASVGLQFLHETSFRSRLTGEIVAVVETSLGEGSAGGVAGVENLLLWAIEPHSSLLMLCGLVPELCVRNP